MASSDVDQKFLGRIATATSNANPLLSSSLYQILGLSVLLSRKLYRARKLRKLDTSRDTKSLQLYQHILWLSREGLGILELYVLPYTQDNQHGPEARVLSVKLRASFYHIFCLFHNQPPITAINVSAGRTAADNLVPPAPLSPRQRQDNGQARPRPGSASSPSATARGKQPMLRDPVTSITSETSFLTNPYASTTPVPQGGPVGTPSPSRAPARPPGLNPVPIPQPSSFLLPPLNFLPLASSHFTTASAYAQAVLPGSHPLRLSVALEHAAFLWDCLHDHEGARRIARRAIKDVYRAQEGMDDAEFEDAAELVGVLGRMMKRKSWEGTPRVGGGVTSPISGPGTVQAGGGGQGNGAPVAPVQQSPRSQNTGKKREDRQTSPTSQRRRSGSGSGSGRSNRGSGGSKNSGSKENTPRVGGTHRSSSGSKSGSGGSKETTPRAAHQRDSLQSGGSTTPRHPAVSGRSPTTPTSVRFVQQSGSGGSGGSRSRTSSSTQRSPGTLRRTSPRTSPTQESAYRSERRR